VEGQFGELEVSDAKRLRALEHENAKLKRLLAEAITDNAGLTDLLSKNGGARREGGSGCSSIQSPKFRPKIVPGRQTDLRYRTLEHRDRLT
jgi:hypothetical protein